MTHPTQDQALAYLDGFIRDALARLQPGEAEGCRWDVGVAWFPTLVMLERNDGGRAYTPSVTTDCDGWLYHIPVKVVPGDQIRLMLPVAAGPYDRPRDIPDPSLTLDSLPIAIAYETGDGVRCIVAVGNGRIWEGPIGDVLPGARLFLGSDPTVDEARRIFGQQYFRHDLTEAMRNEAGRP